jgi:hypothetical protein
MMFPAISSKPRTRLSGCLAALLMAVVVAPCTVARADPEPPPAPLRHVQYTVWTEQPYGNAEIYYRDTDPPNWAEYSHNPYLYSPNVEAHVGPDQKWILDAYLADPDSWAMVTTGIAADSKALPNFHCVLAVDGVVVKTAQGPRGALCSIRAW